MAKKNILQKEGGGSLTRHTIPEEEKESFVEHINRLLSGDPDLKGVVPIASNTLDLFTAVQSGVLLTKLIEATVPGTIPLQKLETKRLNAFNMINNHNITIDGAKAIGCNLINIGAEDLREGKPILVMGLIWQIIKIGIVLQMQNIIKRLGLQAEYEGVKDPQEILLLWVNSHLRRAGYPKVVKNFEGDIKDGEVYSILLNQLAPNLCPLEPMLNAGSDLKRAELVLDNAEKLGARKFVHAADIVSGNARLNFAFTAGLFSISPSVKDVTPVVKPAVVDRSAEDDELARLRKENKELRSENSELLDRIKRLESDLSASRKESEELRDELEETEAELKHAKSQKKDLEERLKALQLSEKDREELEAMLRESEEQSAKKEAQLKAEIKKLQAEKKKIQRLSQRMQGNVLSIQSEKMRLQEEMQRKDTEIKIMKEDQWVRKKAEAEKTDEYIKISLKDCLEGSVKSGWLLKKANRGKKMKKRYLVLRGAYLFYFVTDKEKQGKKPRGSKFIRLASAKVETKSLGKGKSKKQAIVITTKLNKQYVLQGAGKKPDEDEFRSWAEEIEKATHLAADLKPVDEKEIARLSSSSSGVRGKVKKAKVDSDDDSENNNSSDDDGKSNGKAKETTKDSIARGSGSSTTTPRASSPRSVSPRGSKKEVQTKTVAKNSKQSEQDDESTSEEEEEEEEQSTSEEEEESSEEDSTD